MGEIVIGHTGVDGHTDRTSEHVTDQPRQHPKTGKDGRGRKRDEHRGDHHFCLRGAVSSTPQWSGCDAQNASIRS